MKGDRGTGIGLRNMLAQQQRSIKDTHTTHAAVADVSGLQGCMPMRNAWRPQAHFTELHNGPSPAAPEGQHIKT